MVKNRTTQHLGCPYCSGRKCLKGYNDLATNYPELVKEWNYSKNKLNPHEVTKRSGKKVWWKCAKGHEWQETVNSRTRTDCQCPECYKLSISMAIVCVESGKIYKKASEACKDLDLHASGSKIYDCAKGKRKTAFGYHWRLATEEEKASIGLISLSPNENIPFKPTLAEEFQLHIPSSYKKIQFDSVRADAQNRMLIDKMGQSVLTPSGSSFLQA